ncbi:MAG: hypothetical protein ACFFD4_39920, partial [Candidatus Odinarchaeota archaeon]
MMTPSRESGTRIYTIGIKEIGILADMFSEDKFTKLFHAELHFVKFLNDLNLKDDESVQNTAKRSIATLLNNFDAGNLVEHCSYFRGGYCSFTRNTVPCGHSRRNHCNILLLPYIGFRSYFGYCKYCSIFSILDFPNVERFGLVGPDLDHYFRCECGFR